MSGLTVLALADALTGVLVPSGEVQLVVLLLANGGVAQKYVSPETYKGLLHSGATPSDGTLKVSYSLWAKWQELLALWPW